MYIYDVMVDLKKAGKGEALNEQQQMEEGSGQAKRTICRWWPAWQKDDSNKLACPWPFGVSLAKLVLLCRRILTAQFNIAHGGQLAAARSLPSLTPNLGVFGTKGVQRLM